MLATVNELLNSKKLPPLDQVQMSALVQHLFNRADKALRIQVAEIAYLDHDHPHALDLFLACALPLAQKMAQRKASRIFTYPSDWQIESMYDGAVNALLRMFRLNAPLTPVPNAFRRYLLRTISLGAIRDYFKRDENWGVSSVEDVGAVPTLSKPFRNNIEQDVITRELLEQVINFPHLREQHRATLQCIATLGPDGALKEHAFTASGDPDRWKRERGRRPILDPGAIAEAMGIGKRDVHRYLCQARVILRDVFNRDGKLFMTR